VPIAASGTDDSPYAHLEPVVAAEVSWGNRVLSKWGRSDPLLDDRSLTLMYPLHVELLRQAFRFPPNITLHAILPRPGYRHDKARLLLSDADHYVAIHSPLPKDWPYGEGEVAL
jgi:hypothetical protein